MLWWLGIVKLVNFLYLRMFLGELEVGRLLLRVEIMEFLFFFDVMGIG